MCDEKVTFPKLRGKMAEKGYSSAKLSDETGICSSSLYRKMNKIVDFTLSDIVLIMRVLNCKFEDIFTKEDFEYVKEKRNSSENPSDERETVG